MVLFSAWTFPSMLPCHPSCSETNIGLHYWGGGGGGGGGGGADLLTLLAALYLIFIKCVLKLFLEVLVERLL